MPKAKKKSHSKVRNLMVFTEDGNPTLPLMVCIARLLAVEHQFNLSQNLKELRMLHYKKQTKMFFLIVKLFLWQNKIEFAFNKIY